jgi:hypothetical protein
MDVGIPYGDCFLTGVHGTFSGGFNRNQSC